MRTDVRAGTMRPMPIARALVAAVLATAMACAWAQGVSRAPSTARIPEREYGPVALQLEAQLRRELNKPIRVDFHRQQAFRLGSGWQVLSIGWWSEGGGEPHCALGAVLGDKVQHWDALAGEAEAPPWACDGEPVLRFTDLDADGCIDVLALYPLRPPSGERFLWPIVLRCAEGGSGYALDARRTAALRAGSPPKSLAQAMLRLSKLPLQPER
jgi:hypothetical protein